MVRRSDKKYPSRLVVKCINETLLRSSANTSESLKFAEGHKIVGNGSIRHDENQIVRF